MGGAQLFTLPSMGPDWAYLLTSFLPLLLELVALGVAIHLRSQEPEEGALGVAASAALAFLGGGWLVYSLLPLLTRMTKDPLLHELTGAQEDAPRAAARASLTGFLSLLFAPLLVWMTLREGLSPWSWYAYRAWALAPLSVVGALMWCQLGASLDARGKAWRVLTWVLLGLWVAVLVVAGLLLLALSGAHWH